MRTVPLLLLLIALSGCQSEPTFQRPTIQRTELFFGLNRPGGGAQVTDAEWRSFVDEVITPRFPSGLTILEARGQWRGNDGKIESEPSRILILLHDRTPDEDRKVEEVRRAYRERFQQEAVMRADSVEWVSF